MEDHFRYLWSHELTLFHEDATFFDINKKHSLSQIKKPDEINFEHKANRIEILELTKESNSEIIESKRNSWLFSTKIRLINNTRIIQENPTKESIFIACCWKEQDDGSYKPNKIARKINSFIQESFGLKSESKRITTLLVQPNPGSELSVKIYSSLRLATLAVIILTDDITSVNGDIYPTQNVVHELGYMMSKLRARETGRIFILKQKCVKIPSNVGNYEYVEFDKEKIILKYYDLVEWLYKKCATITHKIVKKTFIEYENQLNNSLKKGEIEPTERKEICEKITLHNNRYDGITPSS